MVNLGKQSMLLDLADPAGRAALETFVKRSDVLLINSTSRCAERLRLTEEDLRRMNPDAIHVRFDAWGGPREGHGPLREYVGYDDNVQAGTGIMARFGGSLEEAEEHAHVGTIDVIAGVAGAFGAVLSLLRRKHWQQVAPSRTSLASVGQYLQYPHLFETQPTWQGRHCTGLHALHRILQARDGWVLLVTGMTLPTDPGSSRPEAAEAEWALRQQQRRQVAQLLGGAGSQGTEPKVASCSTEELCSRLRALHLPHARLRSLAKVVQDHVVSQADPWGRGSYQFLACPDHPLGRVVMAAPVAIRMRQVRYELSPVAPKYGAHTEQLLRSIRKSELLLTEVACASWCTDYIPARGPCAVCREAVALLALPCSHALCLECCRVSFRRGDSEVSRCPTCRQGHGMSPEDLAWTLWRREYLSWRTGAPRGARQEPSGRGPRGRSPSLERARSCPCIFREEHSAQMKGMLKAESGTDISLQG